MENLFTHIITNLLENAIKYTLDGESPEIATKYYEKSVQIAVKDHGVGIPEPDQEKLSVLFTTEGTYPFMGGGVSTWCHILCEFLPEIDWEIFAVVADPGGEDKYATHEFPQIRSIMKVPLWGAEEQAEYIDTRPFRFSFRRKVTTTQRVIKTKFVPLFQELLEGFENPGIDMWKYGKTVHEIYKYFQAYDYRETMRSEATWNCWRISLGISMSLGTWDLIPIQVLVAQYQKT